VKLAAIELSFAGSRPSLTPYWASVTRGILWLTTAAAGAGGRGAGGASPGLGLLLVLVLLLLLIVLVLPVVTDIGAGDCVGGCTGSRCFCC